MKPSLCFLYTVAFVLCFTVSCETTDPKVETMSAPTGLTAAEVTHNSATLIWSHSDADKHELILGDGEAQNITGLTYKPGNLTAQTEYTWRIRSGKNNVWSEWIDGPSFRTLHPAEPEMIFVEGGTFMMGSDAEWAEPRESPVHQVTLSGFYIGKYEVTQAQWNAIMDTNPSYHQGDDLPVEGMLYTEVQEFVARLNVATDGKYALPTEAQWEFAARGGNQSRGYKYAGSDDIEQVAWYYGNSAADMTHPVGQKLPNELGLYDMSGNVWEYCRDWYGEYPSEAQTDPVGPSDGLGPVARGCGWSVRIQWCHLTYRLDFNPNARGAATGLRLVRIL